MADLEVALTWLGMYQYYDRFVQAGFDSWDTMLEITKSDLDALDVEQGHQQKLQREIANTHRLAQDTAFVSPINDPVPRSTNSASSSISSRTEPHVASSGKRGYRHRPKPDENAPQRPYSAYVLFSNYVREELKDLSLPFSNISRLVGERWQAMSPAEKDAWKQKAAVPWEKYKQDMAEYKKTENYSNYARYLTTFQAAQDNKKVAIRPQSNQTSPSDSNNDRESKSPGASLSQNSRPVEGFPSSQTFKSRINSADQVEGSYVDAKRQETGVPISRLTPSVARHNTPNTRLRRVSQACEPCRSRKSKCDGERPRCKRCHDLDLECRYEDGKKDRGKRLTEQLWKKVTAYENLLLRNFGDLSQDQQSAVKSALLMPPEVEHDEDAVLTKIGQNISQDHGSESGGESAASGVGSMGSTDHVNEDNLQHPKGAEGDQPFVGQASDLQWMQRLITDLTKKPEQPVSGPEQETHTEPAQSVPAALRHAVLDASKPDEYPDEMDSPFTGDQIDPYGLPTKPTTHTLIDIYFATIHPSFPILEHNVFLDEYTQYVASAEPREDSRFRTFVPVLQLVLAIGAIHAHLTHAEWAGSDRDHLLYFARARTLGGESGLFKDLVYVAQVQMFGLSAMYFLAADQVNRAWNVLGLATRCAQALGMHLDYNLRGLSEEDKLTRVRMWYAIVSLERILSMVTGRPAMVKPTDCSAPVPLPASLPDEDSLKGTSESSQILSLTDYQTHSASATTSMLSSGTQGPKRYDKPTESITMTFFYYYLELNALGQKVLENLYCPHIRHAKWSTIQDRVSDLNAQLSQWSMTLPAALDITTASQDPRIESFRVALAILSNSLRTIINRPSLCSKDRRVPHQSDSSVNANHDSATMCVSSARAVLALLPTVPDPQSIRQSPVWWTLIYHIKRAVTVLMLEMSFRAEHMPSEAEEILKDAKKARNWLLSMASTSRAARLSGERLSRLLKLAAQRIGGTTDDITTAPMVLQSTSSMPDFQLSPEHMATDLRGFDPDIWEPMDFMAHGENSFLSDAQVDAALCPTDPVVAGDWFPTTDEADGMTFSETYQEGRSQEWFGFDGRPY